VRVITETRRGHTCTLFDIYVFIQREVGTILSILIKTLFGINSFNLSNGRLYDSNKYSDVHINNTVI
jgi:hypothetical protein